MFKNYLTIAYRTLLKNKIFSVINILGLSIGMAACLLILYYVKYELSYDQFNKNLPELYRLRYERANQGADKVNFASACPAAGSAMKKHFSEVENVGRIYKTEGIISYNNDLKFNEKDIFYGETNIFKMFSFDLVKGDTAKLLDEPNTVVLSESTVKKYFGEEDPIGKVLNLNKRTDFKVTGVFKDIPKNSHLNFNIMLSYPTFERLLGERGRNSWFYSGFYTYLKLKPQTKPENLKGRIGKMIQSEIGEVLEKHKMSIKLHLQPISEIHLNSNYRQELALNGDKDSIYFLLIIAFFIIIIAWINYINLSTAGALERAKEIGIRKVVGAVRYQLRIQFLIEAALQNFIAVFLAGVFVETFSPLFSNLTGIPENISIWSQTWVWIALGILFIVGTVFSSLYTIFSLIKFVPIDVLKGKFGTSSKGTRLRKALVIFQFAASIALIGGTFTVYQQIEYMRNQDLGVNISQTLIADSPRVIDSTYISRFQTFKDAVLKTGEVEKISYSSEVPGRQIRFNRGGIFKKGENPKTDGKNYRILEVDESFIDLYNLEVLKGRAFSIEHKSDRQAIILNEAAVKQANINSIEEAIGEIIYIRNQPNKIIGVIKNYHQQSLKSSFEPQILRVRRGGRGNISFKIAAGKTKSAVNTIENIWEKHFSQNPFEFFFLDDYYNQQYKTEKLFAKVFGLFAVLALIITSLGILGLSAYSASRRTKEIGVRKVLGAKSSGIITLFAKDFFWLAVIANIIITPLTYWGLNSWLENFAFRTSVTWIIFIIPLFVVLVITIFTVGFQTAKVARRNPVKSLRYE